MVCYEFQEGTSSKFWEIALDGTSFTTTYGRIGTDGQSTTKSFADEAAAKKEHDKLVAEKTKKGYGFVGGAFVAVAFAKSAKAAAPPKAAPPAKGAPAKGAPAKGAPAKAAPTAPAAASGEARYEFQEGTSSKF